MSIFRSPRERSTVLSIRMSGCRRHIKCSDERSGAACMEAMPSATFVRISILCQGWRQSKSRARLAKATDSGLPRQDWPSERYWAHWVREHLTRSPSSLSTAVDKTAGMHTSDYPRKGMCVTAMLTMTSSHDEKCGWCCRESSITE